MERKIHLIVDYYLSEMRNKILEKINSYIILNAKAQNKNPETINILICGCGYSTNLSKKYYQETIPVNSEYSLKLLALHKSIVKTDYRRDLIVEYYTNVSLHCNSLNDIEIFVPKDIWKKFVFPYVYLPTNTATPEAEKYYNKISESGVLTKHMELAKEIELDKILLGIK